MILMAMAAAAATPASPAAQGWQTLARADAEAALMLIAENHPGAAPSLGDTAFQRRLANARETAAERLPLVKDYGSYSALMLGLANAFGDGHIWSSGRISPQTVNWPGLISVRRGGKWLVGIDARDSREPDLSNSEIVACDGVPAQKLGRDRVGGFQADPESEAAMEGKAYSLFLDNGNPWAAPFKRCTFRLSNGRTVDADLDWSSIRATSLQPKLAEALRPAQAGMGIGDVGKGGKWIALQTLGDEASAVVEGARKRTTELRAAPLVVVDLRGNGGGNSDYARQLAGILVGDARVEAVATPVTECDGAYWRVSEGNLEELRQLAATRPEPSKSHFAELASNMAAAGAKGQTFAPALPACAAKSIPTRAPSRNLPASAMKGRLVLLTDRACFSSCLIATDIFRKIGALHVGGATDRSTRYMEVREIVLPSGLRTFSTLMKAAVGLPDYGPFAPEVAYPGPLDDTDALKAWVAALPR